VPYRNVRYWLGDFRHRRAVTKEEKFNHAHARLRNVIERAFGVLKSRFSILKQMTSFDLHVQRDIVIACFAIHNYIRMTKLKDSLFEEYDNPGYIGQSELPGEDDMEFSTAPQWGGADQQFMAQLREQIALQLMQNRV
jgi:hypothetical protein